MYILLVRNNLGPPIVLVGLHTHSAADILTVTTKTYQNMWVLGIDLYLDIFGALPFLFASSACQFSAVYVTLVGQPPIFLRPFGN